MPGSHKEDSKVIAFSFPLSVLCFCLLFPTHTHPTKGSSTDKSEHTNIDTHARYVFTPLTLPVLPMIIFTLIIVYFHFGGSGRDERKESTKEAGKRLHIRMHTNPFSICKRFLYFKTSPLAKRCELILADHIRLTLQLEARPVLLGLLCARGYHVTGTDCLFPQYNLCQEEDWMLLNCFVGLCHTVTRGHVIF